jgi:hypothetical protein
MIGIDEISNFSSGIAHPTPRLDAILMAVRHDPGIALPTENLFLQGFHFQFVPRTFERLLRTWLVVDSDLAVSHLFLFQVDQHKDAFLGAPAMAPAASKCNNCSRGDLLPRTSAS